MTDPFDQIPEDWFHEHSGERLVISARKVGELIKAAKEAHHEMRTTSAPRDSFTDALDALDDALYNPRATRLS